MTDPHALLADANPVNDDELAPSFDELWRRFQNPPASRPLKGRRSRYGIVGGLGFAAVLAGVLVLFVVPGGSSVRPTSAAAAVLARAASAVDQPNTIFYVRVDDYNANGRGTELLGGTQEPTHDTMCVPGPCNSPPPATARTGISANPADDTLTYSFKQWASADGNQVHTIYSNGDETVRNTSSETYSSYDPADNTLTALSHMVYPRTTQGALSTLADNVFDGSLIPFIQDPHYYKRLLHDAQTNAHGGGENATGLPSVSAKLLRQTTIAHRPVYELRFEVNWAPLPKEQILLYIDARTFLPVRSVGTVFNVNDYEGAPRGTAISDVADYSIQSLPDTPSNHGLVEMAPHPGATHVQATLAQYNNQHGVLRPSN